MTNTAAKGGEGKPTARRRQTLECQATATVTVRTLVAVVVAELLLRRVVSGELLAGNEIPEGDGGRRGWRWVGCWRDIIPDAALAVTTRLSLRSGCRQWRQRF